MPEESAPSTKYFVAAINRDSIKSTEAGLKYFVLGALSSGMLLDAIPKMHDTGRARTPVSGEVPNPLNPPGGCTFNPRCPHANERCRTERPEFLQFQGVRVACHAVEEGRI